MSRRKKKRELLVDESPNGESGMEPEIEKETVSVHVDPEKAELELGSILNQKDFEEIQADKGKETDQDISARFKEFRQDFNDRLNLIELQLRDMKEKLAASPPPAVEKEKLEDLEQRLQELSTREKTGELAQEERLAVLESRVAAAPGGDETAGELSERVAAIEKELQKLDQNFQALQTASPQAQPQSRPSSQMENISSSSAPFYLPPPKEPSIIQFGLDKLLEVMVKHKASDLHIKPGVRPMARLNGELIPVGTTALTAADTQKLILEAMPVGIVQRFYRQGFVDYSCALLDMRFRVNAYRQLSGMSAAIRLLQLIPAFEELNLPPILKKLTDFNHGLILITGPAGNGKSTTLAAMINQINLTQKKHIITIEDPIEFVHEDKQSLVSQREVGTDAPTFFDALKQALRQDPNVILIGEMRDPETIWTAAMAAETGHLVLSTLHTPNAVQSIDRILNVFEGEQQRQFRRLLAHNLRAVVSERLLPRKDGKGRIPAVEVMLSTPTIASLIAEGATSEIYQYIVQGGQDGMQTFTESLTKLYESGLITKETALYHAEHPTEFRLGIEGHPTSDTVLDWSAAP